MAVLAKIEEFGDELGIVLSKEILAHLDAKEGDTLEFVTTQDGLLLKSHDHRFERNMAALRHVMAENRDVLRKLADS